MTVATTDGTTIIGESILISGSLNGDEDLTVRGRVEGTLTLTKTLVVEPTGIVKAEVQVKNCVIAGAIVGNVTATESVEITKEGRMVGDIAHGRDGATAWLRHKLHQRRANRSNIRHHYDVSNAFYRMFLDERLVDRARVKRVGDGFRKFLAIVGNRSARPAQRERRPDHDGVAELRRSAHRGCCAVHEHIA